MMMMMMMMMMVTMHVVVHVFRAASLHASGQARMFMFEFSRVEFRGPIVIAKRALGMEQLQCAIVVEITYAIRITRRMHRRVGVVITSHVTTSLRRSVSRLLVRRRSSMVI